MSTEYRIEFSIQRCTDPEGGEFVEIGFGSSGEWADLDMASHMVTSLVDNGEWETELGHPSPDAVMREIERSRDRG